MNTERPIPILLYHKIGQPPRGARVPGQYVSPGLFRRHMAYLKAHGFHTVSLLDIARPGRPLPSRPVAITFDDGYHCIYEHAFPVLRELDFRAAVFLVAGSLGSSNTWEQAVGDVAEPLLGLEQIRQMQEAQIEFGSHTLAHPHLTALPPEEARREIAESRRRLEDCLQASCLSFAYPYGDWDARLRDMVEEAGYEAACTTRRAAARRTDDMFALPRINIRRYNVTARFAYKIWRAGRVTS